MTLATEARPVRRLYPRWEVLFQRSFAVALALPAVTWAVTGLFTRYAADDYCTAGILATRGFWGAQVHWYRDFSPRFAFSFVVTLVEEAGPAIVPVLPILALAAFVAALAWAARPLLGGSRRLTGSLVLAAAVAFATLAATPDLSQSLYWQTGMLTYLLPIVLMLAYAGIVGRIGEPAAGQGLWLALGFALPFAAGGLSETPLFPEIAALALGLGAAVLLRRRGLRDPVVLVLAAGLAGSLAALIGILASPSIALRTDGLRPPVPVALVATVRGVALFIAHFLHYDAPIGLFALLAPLALSTAGVIAPSDRLTPALSRRGSIVLTGALAVLLVASYGPAEGALGAAPPLRAQIVPTFALVAFLAECGAALGTALQQGLGGHHEALQALAVAVAVVVPLGVAVRTVPGIPSAAAYAARWDAMSAQVARDRQAGARDVTVAPLPVALNEPFVGPDRTDWFNVCVARYFGVRTIAAPSQTP